MQFQSGLSGLNAASQNLDVIGNNISNVSTIGYKGSTAQFADIYANALQASGGVQVGIGANLSAVSQQFSQGNIESTNNPLDVAINGGGFFQLSTNGVTTYTRDGEFQVNNAGDLVTSTGAYVQGYSVDANGNIVATNPGNLQLSTAGIAPAATTTSTMQLNLDSTQPAITATFNPNDPTTYTYSTSQTVYDSLGNSHVLSTYFVKTGSNAWTMYPAVDGTQTNVTPASVNLTFDANGALTAPTSPTTISFQPGTGAASPQSFTLALTGTTQYGMTSAATAMTQNGNTGGSLSNFSINSDGTIVGNYTDGQSKTLGQIVLANFTNPQGLASLSGNQWAQTAASGQPLVSAPGTSNFGVLQASSLEQSNVDLTAQLVNLMTAQYDYQANAQTIKTDSQLMQTIESL
ncbi:MAG: flagellar hook protein FlgE [Betaproteobacteria bacterium]|nr:flagellar hook protein FlgE [Betaproteobacteria bacterium]